MHQTACKGADQLNEQVLPSLQEDLSNNGDFIMNVKKCYFCNVWLNNNNNSILVRMYDGRAIVSCHVCRGFVADANSMESLDKFCLSNASGGEMR